MTTPFTKWYYDNYKDKPWIKWTLEAILNKTLNTKFPSKDFLKIIKSIPVNWKVLDVWCWTWKILNEIKQIRPDISVTGIDIWQLESFRQNLGSGEKISFINWDFFQTEFKEKFDFIYSCYVIEHLLNADEFIKKIYQLLNKWGKVYIETMSDRSLIWWTFYDDYTHVKPFSKVSAKRILSENWFKDVNVKIKRWKIIMAVSPYLLLKSIFLLDSVALKTMASTFLWDKIYFTWKR